MDALVAEELTKNYGNKVLALDRVNIITALVVICLTIVAVATAPSLREWFKWRKR